MLKLRKWERVADQTWEDILFIHLPVEEKNLRPFVPGPFIINKFNGTAWISIVLFTAKHSKLRRIPPKFSYPNFEQVNVRTYVNFGKEKGIYFLSVLVDDPLVVKGGKLLELPYIFSSIKREDSTIEIPGKKFACTFSVKDGRQKFVSEIGSLDYFLTEKYCIWSVKGRKIIKLPISHLPWVLQKADISMTESTLIDDRIVITGKPIAHYASNMTAYVHPYETFGYYHN